MAKEVTTVAYIESSTTFDDEVTPAGDVQRQGDGVDDKVVNGVKSMDNVTPEMSKKMAAFHRRRDEEGVAPSADFRHIFDKIFLMTEDEAVDILVKAIEFHKDDRNFPGPTMKKIQLLVQGSKAVGLETTDYDFDLKAEAAIIHYHSPYPEVRSVTDAFDDPTIPVETFRSYF
jgi:hypothetical protein